jgi:DNA-binding response OmpR family regulator
VRLAKVLIVDDDKTTVMLLKTLLELDGFEIETIGRGGGVMEIANNFQPDVILMDYHLSDMDGVDVLRDLRSTEQYADLPIVIASGLDVGDEVLEAGANKFLVKPFEPDELPGLFNSLISG